MRYAGWALAAALVATVPLAAGPDRVASFTPVATFNVPGGLGSAEIVTATPDGHRLVYSDAVSKRLGLIDLDDPASPVEIGAISLTGSPTSVAALPDGAYAVAAIQPGELALVSLSPFAVVARLPIGQGPDSVAVTEVDGRVVAVVAIENEGALPEGTLEVITLNLTDFPASERRIVCFVSAPGCDVDASAEYAAAGPLHSADEGEEDFEGSRGWTAYASSGGVLSDDGGVSRTLSRRSV